MVDIHHLEDNIFTITASETHTKKDFETLMPRLEQEALRHKTLRLAWEMHEQSCGCCKGYSEFLEKHGITVEVINTNNLVQLTMDRGMSASAMCCHITLTNGYGVEGHAPLVTLKQLFTEQSGVNGIALPGIPVDTLGIPGQKKAAFDMLVLENSGLEPFGSF